MVGAAVGLELLPRAVAPLIDAASLTMIDRHYGHLARDGRDHGVTS
jgi:hypothetical protein